MEDLRRILAAHPVFQGMPDDYLALLVGCATNVRLPADSYAFQEGRPADTFYLLRAGAVALEIHTPAGPPLLVDTLEAGDVLGWSWLFPPYRWTYDAHVVAPVRAVALDGACLRGKCEDDPVLGYELMRRFAQIVVERLQATRLQLMDIYGHVAHT